LQDLIRWYFDFLRNVLITVTIMYLAVKTHSRALEYVGLFSSVALAASIVVRMAWIFEPFYFVKSPWVRLPLNMVAMAITTGVAVFGFLWLLGRFVFRLLDAQLF
jgi:hypothetical protein